MRPSRPRPATRTEWRRPAAATQSWRRIATELGRVHEVTVSTDAGAVTYTSAITDTARDLLGACEVKPPPKITHLDPG